MSAPPPPPPPPASAAIPPPPPPPALSKDEKEEQERKKMALQETVVAAASALEKGRCLETEVEAALLVSSCLLRHAPGTSIEDMGDYPGGVKDACRVLEIHTKDTTAAAGGGVEGDPPRIMRMDTTTTNDNHHNHDDDPNVIQIPGGSLGKTVHTLALSTCLTRAATASQSIVKQRETSKELLTQAMSATATDVSSSATLLEIMDTKLRDIRDYHARHDITTTLLQQQQHQQPPPHKKIRTTSGGVGGGGAGQPVADGYDLASLVREETSVSKLETLFAPDEIMGKYLDLGNVYERHIDLLKMFMLKKEEGKPNTSSGNNHNHKQVPYIDFLSFLTSKGLALWTEQDKLNHRKKYMRFLVDMLEYLKGFLQRTSPLLKVEEALVKPAQDEFHNTWRLHGGCPGYHYIPAEASLAIVNVKGDNDTLRSDKDNDNKVDLTPYNSPEELHSSVDAGILKTELSRLGLKCGGTPLDRAKRLFQTKDTPLDKLPKKLFAKGGKRTLPSPQGGNTTTTANTSSSTTTTTTITTNTGRRFDVAKTEAIVTMLLDQLRPNLEATLRRAERRTTQTNKERMQEVEEELYGNAEAQGEKKKKGDGEDGNENDDSDDDSDDEDEEPIYNPKGVPLGWDGKPIPYWLFKLHGLNHFYLCEICGNESYRGRRNFEKHFAEAKHAYGMKCLGIPNTQHFHGVTKIEDAQQLWKSLESKMKEDKFDDRKEEEYEDSHGNVLSRATYEDLARQGLL